MLRKPINLKDLWSDHPEQAAAAVQEILDHEQHGCRERILTVQIIKDILQEVEDYLLISKAAMKGVTVDVDPFAQRFPSSYTRKGRPMTTQFQAMFIQGSWKLTAVARYFATGTKRVHIELTACARDAILHRLSYID